MNILDDLDIKGHREYYVGAYIIKRSKRISTYFLLTKCNNNNFASHSLSTSGLKDTRFISGSHSWTCRMLG